MPESRRNIQSVSFSEHHLCCCFVWGGGGGRAGGLGGQAGDRNPNRVSLKTVNRKHACTHTRLVRAGVCNYWRQAPDTEHLLSSLLRERDREREREREREKTIGQRTHFLPSSHCFPLPHLSISQPPIPPLPSPLSKPAFASPPSHRYLPEGDGRRWGRFFNNFTTMMRITHLRSTQIRLRSVQAPLYFQEL